MRSFWCTKRETAPLKASVAHCMRTGREDYIFCCINCFQVNDLIRQTARAPNLLRPCIVYIFCCINCFQVNDLIRQTARAPNLLCPCIVYIFCCINCFQVNDLIRQTARAPNLLCPCILNALEAGGDALNLSRGGPRMHVN